MMQYPEVLAFLTILIPIGLVVRNRYIRGRADLGIIGGGWRESRLQEAFVVKWFFSSIALIGCIVFGVLSLSGFTTRQYPVIRDPVGQDVVIVMDVSRSMLVEDVAPNRLLRAARMSRGIVETVDRTRFSLVIFKGRGSLLIPLTEDTDALLTGISIIGPDLITAPGTDLQQGIAAAIDALTPAVGTRKVVILFTDGEALTGDMRQAASALEAAGIELYAIGIGTREGGSVPDGRGGSVVDREGRQVVSRLDMDSLKSLVEAVGGKAMNIADSRTQGELIDSLYFPGRGKAMEISYAPVDNYRTFLGIALLFLLIHVGVRTIRRRGAF